jgi:hypothetical protein
MDSLNIMSSRYLATGLVGRVQLWVSQISTQTSRIVRIHPLAANCAVPTAGLCSKGDPGHPGSPCFLSLSDILPPKKLTPRAPSPHTFSRSRPERTSPNHGCSMPCQIVMDPYSQL